MVDEDRRAAGAKIGVIAFGSRASNKVAVTALKRQQIEVRSGYMLLLLNRAHRPIELEDARNLLSPSRMKDLKFEYYSVGQPDY